MGENHIPTPDIAKLSLLKNLNRRGVVRPDDGERLMLDTVQGPKWEQEEITSMINRRSAPQVRLTRAASASRRTIFASLKDEAVVGSPPAKASLDTVSSTKLGSRSRPPPTTPSREPAGAETEAEAASGADDEIAVQSYIQEVNVGVMQGGTVPRWRNFSEDLRGGGQGGGARGIRMSARRSVAQEYMMVKSNQSKMNPYADVEPIFQRHRNGAPPPRQRRDPWDQCPYFDQPGGAKITRLARKFRIKVASFGLLDSRRGGHHAQSKAKRGGNDDDEGGRGGEDGDDVTAEGLLKRIAVRLFNVQEAWGRMPDQDTFQVKLKKDAVKRGGEKGTGPSSMLPEIDQVEETWQAPVERRGQSMTSVSTNLTLLFGGVVPGSKKASGQRREKYSSAVHKLLLNPPHWEVVEPTGSKPSGRAFHSSHLVDDGKLIIFGGLGAAGNMNDCFELDLRAWQWNVVFMNGAEIPSPRHGHTLSETPFDGTCVLFGGAGAGFYNDLYLFDARTGRWTRLLTRGNKPTPRAFHTAVSLVHATKLFVFGGQNGSSTLNDLHELDLESLTWTFVRTRGVQPSPRWGHSSLSVGMDVMLTFGGAGETFSDELIIFNAFKSQWSYVHGLGAPPSARWGHSSVLKRETGQLIISCGSENGKPYLGDTYIFNMAAIQKGPPPKVAENKQKGAATAAVRTKALQNMLRVKDEKPSWEQGEREFVRRWSAPRGRRYEGVAMKAKVFTKKLGRW